MRRFGIKLLLPLLALGRARGEYVDARQCATCHAKIAQTYSQVGMSRSFFRLTPQNTVEDFNRGNPFFQKQSGTWYFMLQRDGRYFQKRWRIGFDGRETDVDELSVDYVMGSGNHARTYLHKTERGTLLELPLAWYSEAGGHWGMSPGHDRGTELPARTVAYECMGCHNAYPKIPAGHDEPGSEFVYSDPLPEGIDCQRCHGPGGDHIRAAKQAGAQAANIRKSIVNSARLSTDRQLEVCMQCHLETTSQQLPHSIVKYGRSPFSYAPGQPLGDFVLFFDRAPGSGHEEDFEIAHSAYRLRKSRCFLESKGAGTKEMTCTTCHNPHEVPRGNQATAHYNGVCRQCHATQLANIPAHSANADCIACHMPKRRTIDVVNVVMTDHLIQRRPPANPLGPIAEAHDDSYRGEVVPYYPNPLPQTAENELYTAVAQVAQSRNLRAGLPRLASAIARQQPARPEFYLELGQAALLARDAETAIQALEEALKREPHSPVASIALGDALTQTGQAPRAIELLNRAVKDTPGDALLWYQLGLANSAAGNMAEALSAFERAVLLDSRMAEAYSQLGTLHAAGGDLAQAEAVLRTALRVQPDLAEASLVLGQVLTARKDFPQATYYFQRAIQADAAIPEAHNYLGTLLQARGEDSAALDEFLEAIKLRPDYGSAHLNAGIILKARGDLAAAKVHFEKASADPDPSVSQRARAALQ